MTERVVILQQANHGHLCNTHFYVLLYWAKLGSTKAWKTT